MNARTVKEAREKIPSSAKTLRAAPSSASKVCILRLRLFFFTCYYCFLFCFVCFFACVCLCALCMCLWCVYMRAFFCSFSFSFMCLAWAWPCPWHVYVCACSIFVPNNMLLIMLIWLQGKVDLSNDFITCAQIKRILERRRRLDVQLKKVKKEEKDVKVIEACAHSAPLQKG